jgi:hypothetical protein
MRRRFRFLSEVGQILLGNAVNGGVEALSINLAIDFYSTVKITRDDVLQKVRGFRERPPLAVFGQVGVAKVFGDFLVAVCALGLCFHRHKPKEYNEKMAASQLVTS